MAFEHQPLPEDQLGPMAARMVGDAAPEKMKRLVAQGAAPLPPRDMIVSLYQLWVTHPTDDLGELAGRTLAGLPDATVTGAVNDRALPPGVLDLMGRKLISKDEIIDAVVRHPQVSDETVIGIARVCGALVCDTIASAQDRWMRAPKIIASLYQNRNCRMSLLHRILEMADREGLDIQMAGIEEVRAAMRQDRESGDTPTDEERDAAFEQAMAGSEVDNGDLADDEFFSDLVEDDLDLPGMDAGVDDDLDLPDMPEDDLGLPELPEPNELEAEPAEPEKKLSRVQEIMNMRPPEKVRTALLGDKSDRAMLIRDPNKVVSMSVVKSPKVSDSEAVGWSANRSLSPEIIRYIANKREWIKLYTIKFNLVMNPKTPMSKAMALLPYLNRGDLAKVARSKGVPSALAKAAKRKIDGGR